MKLTPLGDRVVLKQLVAEETTKSGIVLPGQNKEKPQQAPFDRLHFIPPLQKSLAVHAPGRY